MIRRSLFVALGALLFCAPMPAQAGDAPSKGELLRGIQEMMEELARAGSRPEGFVEPPDPATCEQFCRLTGTVRVGSAPLAGSKLTLLWLSRDTAVSSRVPPVTTSKDGFFTFPRVPLGEYRMVGSEAGRLVWEYRAVIVLTSSGERELSVTLGASSLVVTVLDQKLRPVAGASVGTANVPGEFMSSVRPEVTDSSGRATIRFLSGGLNRLHAFVGDADSFMGVYGDDDVGSAHMILPPFGTVEVQVDGWEAEGSLGSMRLTCTKDGHTRTLARSLDATGHAVLRCSPGQWDFSLEVFGRASSVPLGKRVLAVRSGETVVVGLEWSRDAKSRGESERNRR